MSWGKAIGLTLLFGVLSVAVLVAGALIGLLLTLVAPIALVFTGLWVVWFINKDFDVDD